MALSFQFFNKTTRNVRENPHAVVEVVDPETLQKWLLEIQYDHSESEGPVFEEMETQREAIATMTGMQDVFKLQAADIYKVKAVHRLREQWIDEG